MTNTPSPTSLFDAWQATPPPDPRALLEHLASLVGPDLDGSNPALDWLCARGRPTIELALLSTCAHALRVFVPARATFPGCLVGDLLTSIGGKPRGVAQAALWASIAARSPAAWQRLQADIHQLQRLTRRWQRWSPAADWGALLRDLDELDDVWAAAEYELCQRRGDRLDPRWRTDPATARSLTSAALLHALVSRLASPSGDVRLMLDYGAAVIETATLEHAAHRRSHRELLVVDVLSHVGPALHGAPPARRGLRLGCPRRRKRVQRARQRALTRLIEDDSRDWTEALRADLRQLGVALAERWPAARAWPVLASAQRAAFVSSQPAGR